MSLLDKYQDFLVHDPITREVLKTEEMLIIREGESLDELKKEFNVFTANNSLEFWEYVLGVKSEIGNSIEERRSRVITLLQSNREMTTPEMIKRIVKNFNCGKCDVIEDFNDYSFLVKFKDVFGKPRQLNEIIKIIELIKPCHLSYGFTFSYITWERLKSRRVRWEDLSVLTWEEAKEKEVR